MSKLLRGVTAQLLLLTVLPLTVILALISCGSISLHQQAMRRLVSERDVRAVVAIAGSIGAVLQHKTDLLGLVADNSSRETQNTDAPAIDPEMAREFPGGLALYDKNGALMASSATAAQWARSAYVISGSSAVSGTFASRVGTMNDMLVLRAQDRSHSVTAVGMLPVSALNFSTLVNPSNETGSIGAFLFGADGRVLADTLPDRSAGRDDAKGTFSVSGHPGVIEALHGQSGGLFRPDPVSGDEHVVSYAPIVTSNGETGLGVIIEEPWQTVLDPLMRYSLAVPLITLPVLLLAMLAVMFGIRRIVQPLQRLDQQARDIGDGNYGVLSQPVHGIEEIDQLQNTLHNMADRIQADQERLRNYAKAVTETQEAERKRLARELHDDTIQNLIVLSQRIQAARQNIAREQPQTAAKLDDLRGEVVRMIEDIRRFSRALRPIYLEDAGLVAALERLAAEANETARRTVDAPAYVVGFMTSGQVSRLKPEAELALFRIAQEGVANALRHAHPTKVSITLTGLQEGGIQLHVEDNGQGFLESVVPTDGRNKPAEPGAGGFGFMGIRERASLIGASVAISSEPGKGTRIVVTYQPR
ncbi:MAG: histidine kinase [Chloroflexi bacterium]|nr:histidine kinase [Chloroflexota bacterium]MCL5273258.1 histidine kinase [Chloroflexota bacterium]